MSEEFLGDPAEETVECACPYCGQRVAFQKAFIDRPADCPYCNAILMVPLTSAQPATKFPLPIKSPRLVLRAVRELDNLDLMDLEGMDAEQVELWTKPDLMNQFLYAGGRLPLIIQLQDEKPVIGTATLSYFGQFYDDRAVRRQAGFELTIDPRFKAQGYEVEAIRAIQDFGFNGLHLHRLTATCDGDAAEYRKILEEAGLRFEGLFYKDRFGADTWLDTAYYAILADEFVK